MAHRGEIDLRHRIFAGHIEVNRQPIAGVILSGGASRRMGTPKALLRFQNETFLDRLIRLFSTTCDTVIVVVGQHAEQIRAGIERSSEVIFAVNPDPERGMLSSLQCGLNALPAESEAVLFTPVDHPHLQGSTLAAMAARFHSEHAPVTVPTFGGRHGHPVCISRPVATELLALPETAKPSDVIHRYIRQTVYVEVDDPAVVTDIDDQAAYAELVTRLS